MLPTLPITATSLATAALMFLGFVLALFLGSRIIPGHVDSGVKLPDGSRIAYRLNGLRLLLLILAGMAAGVAFGLFSPAVIHAHFWPLLVVANVFAFVATAWLWRRGQRRARLHGSGLFEARAGVLGALK